MSPNWFTPGEASAKRSYLRDLVIRLAAELAAGKTAILGRDNLKVLWTDVILGGSDARVGVQTRRADRARENPLKVDEPAGGRRNGPPKASVNRPRKEEGEGRTAPTSAYDEELEGAGEEGEGVADASAKGQNGARAVPLTEDVLKAALREDPGAAVDPDNPLSVDLDPSPQKRKRSTEAAAEGGDAGAAVPSGAVKAEKGREPSPVTDPLAHYRVYKELASSKAQKEASKSAALNQANNPSGPPLAEHAEVRRKGADESVPDSEDEDEAPREKKRERSGRADKSAGSGSEGDGSASEGPRKRVRSDSEGPETAPVRGGRSDGDQSLLVAGGSAGEASGGEGEAVRRKRMETSPVEGRLGAADGTADRDPSSDDSESESMRGLEGFHEDKARLSGGAGERSEAREDSLSAKKGNRAGESEGEKGPGERSRMQMVVHPAMGVLHEVDELGGSPLSDNDGEDEGGEEGATHYQGRSERGALEVALKEGGVEDEAVGKERGDDQWSGEEGGRGTGGVRGRSGDGSDGEGGRFAVRERGESPGPGTDPAWESSEEPGSFARGKKSTHRRSSSREARPPVEPQGKAELVKEITAGVIRAVSRTQGESGGPEGTERGFSEELDAGESPGPFRARWAPGEGWGAGEERLLSREEKNVRDRPAGLASFFEEESMEGEGKGDFGGNARTRGPAKSWLADGEENENEVEFLGEAVSAPSGGGLTGRSGRRAEGGAVGGKENGAPAVGGEKSAERTSVEKILQRVRPPKHWEGDPELGGTERRGKSVERQGKALSRGDGQTESASRLDRRSGPSEAMMRKTDGLLDRLLDNVQIEKSLAESRQGTELEAAAQPGLKKIDRLRRKATENLLSGSPERPSREPGYEEGLATEARFMLGEPAGLMAGGEVKPGRADSPGSPVFEPVAHDREPVSQNFTEDDDERSEPESASAEAESRDWEGTGDRGKAGPSERRGEATSDRFLKTDRAALAGNGDERSSERGTKRARTSLENDPHSRDYLAEGRRDDEAMGADTEREGKATESPDEAVQGVKIPGVFPPEPPSSGFRFLSLGEGSLLERSPLGSESGNPFVTDSGETRRRPGTREPVPAPESGATAPAEDDDCTIVSAPSRSPLFGPPGHQGTRTEATRLGSSGTGRSPRNGEVLLGGGSAGQTGKKAGEGARSFANGLAGSKGKASLLQTGAVIRRGSGQANGNGSAGKGADIRKDNGRELTGFEDLDPDEDTEGFVPERRHRQAGLTGGAKGMETEDRWQAGGGNGSPLREGAEGGVGDWANAERLVAGGRKGPRLSFDSWQEGDMPEGEGSRRKVVSLKKLMRDTRAQEGETSGESRGNEREERTPPPRDVAIESSSRHAVANGVGVMEKPAVAKREVWTLDSDEDEHMVVDEAAEKRRQRPKRKTREEKSAERKQKLRELLDERESGGAARTLIPV